MHSAWRICTMFRALADYRRLFRAARVLGRHDALLPREYATVFPSR